MRLPVPNAEEVGRFAALYESRFGVRLAPAEAHDVFSRLVAYVYLTGYGRPEGERPDRDGSSLSEGREREIDANVRRARLDEARERERRRMARRDAELDHERWYESVGDGGREECG
jgi:hypothetical protein